MTQRLTKKQKGFVKDYIETGIGSLAAKKNYAVTTDESARAVASQNLTKPQILNAIKEALPNDLLAEKHLQLLNSTRVDHLVFPLGPDTDEGDPSEGPPIGPEVPESFKDRTSLTDKEITDMLAEVNCTVRRIVHGETARHVYFWSADNRALKDALDMAYKLRGDYAPEKKINVNLNPEPSEKVRRLAEKLVEMQKHPNEKQIP